jgi:hypothetical protein
MLPAKSRTTTDELPTPPETKTWLFASSTARSPKFVTGRVVRVAAGAPGGSVSARKQDGEEETSLELHCSWQKSELPRAIANDLKGYFCLSAKPGRAENPAEGVAWTSTAAFRECVA